MKDTITILRTPARSRRILAKRHTWTAAGWETSSYDEVKHFEWEQREIEGIRELATLLDELAGDPKACVIRAEPIEGIPQRVRRLLHHDKKADEGPFWERHPDGHRWVILDLDQVPVPPIDVATGPSEAAVRWVINRCLPAPFRRATCHYTWSASAGVKPWTDGPRLHLAFWLSGQVCEEALDAWATANGFIDVSMLRPVQVHYTAAPLFEGASDPIAERSGLLVGDVDEVDLGALSDGSPDGAPLVDAMTWLTRQGDHFDLDSDVKADEHIKKSSDIDVVTRRGSWAKAKVDAAVAEILNLPDGGRSDGINRLVYGVARVVDAGGLVHDEVLRVLEDAAVHVGSNEKKDRSTVRRAWEAGLRDPRSLDHIGAGPAAQPGPAIQTPAPEPKVSVEDYYCSTTRRLTVGGRAIVAGKIGAEAVPGVWGAPHPDARVPVGYYLTPYATGWHSGEKAGVVVPCPVVVAGRCEDVDSGALQMLVAWKEPGRGGWRRRLLAREEALGRGVQGLARWGLPITSDGTKGLSKWLVEYERENYQMLPTLRTSHALGWQGDYGRDGFLLGYRHITEAGETLVDLDKWTSTALGENAVAFQASDDGDRHLVEGFACRGDLRRWLDAAALLRPYPKAALGVLSSLAAPLLELVGARGFAVDWSGPSSTGKSTVMRFAASVWGDPFAIVKVWDASDTFIERLFGTLNNLPFFLDETQRVERGPERHKALVATAIYMAENGHGRGRGSLGGTQASRRWRTILMSTGEQPATTIGDQRGGANARCVQITGRPFGAGKKESLVHALDDAAQAHFGHMGTAWLRMLLANRKRWSEWSELYDGLRRDYTEDTRSGAESRLAAARAVLELTRRLLLEMFHLDLGDPVTETWQLVTAHAGDAVGELRAMEDVIGWVAANETRFYDSSHPRNQPNNGWLGAMQTDYVAVLPPALDSYLRERGYQPQAIVNAWRERGWLLLESRSDSRGDRDTRKVRINGARPRCYCIPAALFERVAPTPGASDG